MKVWPDNDKPVSFDELYEPFIKTVKFSYKLTRKNVGKPIPYSGYEHGNLAGCLGIQESLTPEALEYHAEQNRDLLTVIIQSAIQVGIEQGRRIAMSSPEVLSLKHRSELVDILLDKIAKS